MKMLMDKRIYLTLLYGHGGHLGHVILTALTKFISSDPSWLHMKFGFNWSSGFTGENV